ncbi:MAG: hypothetical protein V1789_08835, partial [PVC group bacterium]
FLLLYGGPKLVMAGGYCVNGVEKLTVNWFPSGWSGKMKQRTAIQIPQPFYTGYANGDEETLIQMAATGFTPPAWVPQPGGVTFVATLTYRDENGSLKEKSVYRSAWFGIFQFGFFLPASLNADGSGDAARDDENRDERSTEEEATQNTRGSRR